MSQAHPKLIVFEGPDEVGKTHLAAQLDGWLREHHISVASLSFPGRENRTLGEIVYKLHHDPSLLDCAPIQPSAVQALHIAAHLDVIGSRILPMLNQGTTIILDRFWWSTWVYGIETGVSKTILNHLVEIEKEAWQGWAPQHVFLIERLRGECTESQLAQERLRKSYSDLAQEEGKLYPVHKINNNGNPSDTLQSICQILADDPES